MLLMIINTSLMPNKRIITKRQQQSQTPNALCARTVCDRLNRRGGGVETELQECFLRDSA
ncbi:unnamed protein product [Brassica oleracea var. botrytis]|uniref:BnaC03g65610D protein n=1 Tax=Brassica napus TaxID=3708 RepID=A0A078FXP5_BRANA|nr:BnaC03g65610D [Brassica napus]